MSIIYKRYVIHGIKSVYENDINWKSVAAAAAAAATAADDGDDDDTWQTLRYYLFNANCVLRNIRACMMLNSYMVWWSGWEAVDCLEYEKKNLMEDSSVYRIKNSWNIGPWK